MTVLLRPIQGAKDTALVVLFSIGGDQDPQGRSGTAHLIEQQAAVRQEGLRRRPEALQGDHVQATARRGIMLLCAVVLSKAGTSGQEAVAAVRDVFRRAYRASSLVECINSVLRMQQAGHRQMTQGLLD